MIFILNSHHAAYQLQRKHYIENEEILRTEEGQNKAQTYLDLKHLRT